MPGVLTGTLSMYVQQIVLEMSINGSFLSFYVLGWENHLNSDVMKTILIVTSCLPNILRKRLDSSISWTLATRRCLYWIWNNVLARSKAPSWRKNEVRALICLIMSTPVPGITTSNFLSPNVKTAWNERMSNIYDVTQVLLRQYVC